MADRLRPRPQLAAELGATIEVLDGLLGSEPTGGDGGDAPLEPAADLQHVPHTRVGDLRDDLEGVAIPLERFRDGAGTPGSAPVRIAS